MGIDVESIKKLEEIAPKNSEDNYLHYHFDWKNNEYYTTEYSFDQNGLFEIVITVFLNNPDNILELYNELKTHYQTKYGIPKNENESGIVVWEIPSKNAQKTEITISETSESGELSIQVIDNNTFGLN